MKDYWLKTGCYLTGYNYDIVRNSSEVVAKTVKKYLSAIIIVSTIWCVVGFCFSNRYLHASTLMSIVFAIVMVIVVIQIERQIILSVGKNKWALFFRSFIGVIMAIIGSVILDQIIFKDDIEKVKIANTQMAIDTLLPTKTSLLTQQIQGLERDIQNKEAERTALNDEVTKAITLSLPSSSIQTSKNADGTINTKRVSANTTIVNPKINLIPKIDSQIKLLQNQRFEKENERLNVRKVLEEEIQSKTGFLDELNLLFSILFSSKVALFLWSIIFLFFLFLELFVVSNKYWDVDSDYDKTVVHQRDVRIKMLNKLN